MGARQLDQRACQEQLFGALTEERHVGRLAHPPAGASDALEEGGDGGRRIGLQHRIQVTHVDPQLEGGGTNDAGIPPVVKALLRQPSLLQRDRAVMDEDVGALAAHPLRDGLGQPALFTIARSASSGAG
jgi:hypothetical protein